MCVAGFAVSPGKPWVPYCEERPGAAHSRRDQMCVVGVSGAQTEPDVTRHAESFATH